MTPDLTLARRAVACPGWRWVAGMLALEDGGSGAVRVTDTTIMIVGTGQHSTYFRNWCLTKKGRGWLPDLSDPATLGAVLGLVRERWGDSGVWCEPDGGDLTRWAAYRSVRALGHRIASGATEAEALIAALEAAPEEA